MPFAAKRDDNVPSIGPRSRYRILGVRPAWIYHQMASGNLDGAAPTRTGETAAETDPDIVEGGKAEFTTLLTGGLFTMLGNYGRPIVVEAADIGAATAKIAKKDGTDLRNAPTTYPFKIPAGEYLKVAGVARAGFLVRLDGEKVF